jgi:hypothetical protein
MKKYEIRTEHLAAKQTVTSLGQQHLKVSLLRTVHKLTLRVLRSLSSNTVQHLHTLSAVVAQNGTLTLKH